MNFFNLTSRPVQPGVASPTEHRHAGDDGMAPPAVPHFADDRDDVAFHHLKRPVQRLAAPMNRRGARVLHRGQPDSGVEREQDLRSTVASWPRDRPSDDRNAQADSADADSSGSSTDGEPYCVVRFAQPPLAVRYNGQGDVARRTPAPIEAAVGGRFALPLHDQWSVQQQQQPSALTSQGGRPVRGVLQCIAVLLAGCVIAIIVVVGSASSSCSGRNTKNCYR